MYLLTPPPAFPSYLSFPLVLSLFYLSIRNDVQARRFLRETIFRVYLLGSSTTRFSRSVGENRASHDTTLSVTSKIERRELEKRTTTVAGDSMIPYPDDFYRRAKMFKYFSAY